MHRVSIASIAALLAACGQVPTLPGVTPHRIEIQQGNFVSQEMVSQLKPGMTREQVRFVLGTPLVTDIFHADRWDYVYFREVPNRPREQRRLSVFFEGGKLARVTGDVVPAADSAPAKPAAATPAPPVAAKPESPVQGESTPKPNWRAASDAPETSPAPTASPPAADAQAGSPASEGNGKRAGSPEKQDQGSAPERGFFGRILDRLKGSP